MTGLSSVMIMKDAHLLLEVFVQDDDGIAAAERSEPQPVAMVDRDVPVVETRKVAELVVRDPLG
ncbi:MAG: hypothetical protein U5K38_05655 [Woeseiaceae bacterium]|nr:hypothetical protein [Woeseiaceae bacterium]